MGARCVRAVIVVGFAAVLAGGCERNGSESEGAAEPTAAARSTRVTASEGRRAHPAPKKTRVDPSVWKFRTDEELDQAIADARREAERKDGQVLLAFIAPWCPDSRQVVRVMHEDPAARVIEERYALVPINVGRFDRHEGLRERHGVDRIAHLVVTSPEGEPVAQKVFEPVSKDAPLTPEALADWLRHPQE